MNDIIPDDANTLPVPPCPSWCATSRHRYMTGHPDDTGYWHESPVLDSWHACEVQAERPLNVRVEGFRHDQNRAGDWGDQVVIDGDTPGGVLDSVWLDPADARRLAQALLAAADLLGKG